MASHEAILREIDHFLRPVDWRFRFCTQPGSGAPPGQNSDLSTNSTIVRNRTALPFVCGQGIHDERQFA